MGKIKSDETYPFIIAFFNKFNEKEHLFQNTYYQDQYWMPQNYGGYSVLPPVRMI